MASEFVLVNGTPEATHFNGRVDRAMSFGDGLFETMLLHDGKIHLLDLHVQRLSHGLSALAIDAEVKNIIQQIPVLIKHYSLETGTYKVKLVVSRVAVDSVGYSTKNAEVAAVIFAEPYNISCSNDIHLGLSPVRLAEQPLLAGIKHCSRLEQVLAKQLQENSEYDDCLLLNSAGSVVEAISSNVFILEGGKLVTPVLKMCGVAGVIRAYIINTIAEFNKILVIEEDVDLQRLTQSDGVCLTSALTGVRLVSQCSIQLDDFSNSHSSSITKQVAQKIEWPRHPLLVALQKTVYQSMLGL